MNLYRILAVVSLATALLLVTASFGVRITAEEATYQVADSVGYVGIYTNGEKCGYGHWTIKNSKVGTSEYFRFTYNEERTYLVKEKEVKESHSYNGTIGLNFAPRDVKYEWKKGGNITTVTGKVKGANAEIAVQFGKAPAAPVQKVAFKAGSTWSYCAPFCWAFAAHEADTPAEFGRILEFNKVALADMLTPTEKTVKFQGEEVEAIEWAAEEGKVVIVTDKDGNLLSYMEKAKTGAESRMISEPQEVAESDMTWEQKDAKGKGMQAGKEKYPGKAKNNNRFKNALDPVDEDEPTTFGPNFYKFPLTDGPTFSVRCAEGWQCQTYVNEQKQPVRFSLKNKDDSAAVIEITLMKNVDEKNAEDFMTMVLGNMKKNQTKVEEETEIETYDFDDTAAAGIMLTFIASNNKIKSYVICVVTDDFGIALVPIISEDAWDDYEDDIYAMLGSARLVE